jgi:tetratricopeptide (TPR) repeat protein
MGGWVGGWVNQRSFFNICPMGVGEGARVGMTRPTKSEQHGCISKVLWTHTNIQAHIHPTSQPPSSRHHHHTTTNNNTNITTTTSSSSFHQQFQHLLPPPTPTTPPTPNTTKKALGNLAEVHRQLKDYNQALPLFQQAIAIHKTAVAAVGGEARVGAMDAMGKCVRVCRCVFCLLFSLFALSISLSVC